MSTEDDIKDYVMGAAQGSDEPTSDSKLEALKKASPSTSSMENTLRLLGAGQPYGSNKR